MNDSEKVLLACDLIKKIEDRTDILMDQLTISDIIRLYFESRFRDKSRFFETTMMIETRNDLQRFMNKKK